MSAAPKLICAGRLYADLVFTGLPGMPTLGTEIYADGLGVYPGGGAVITAAWAVAHGLQAELLATLPADPFGAVLRPAIAAHGIGMELCTAAPPGCDPQITVAMALDGDRAFLTRRAGAALPDDAGALIAASGARHLHIAELATLLDYPDLPAVARNAGLTVSLDCAWDEAAFRAEAGPLIAAVDVFFPNESEAMALEGAGIALPAAPLTVIKRGAAGAELVTGQSRLALPAESADVIDTTGAGDAFDGGFLACWLTGGTPEACLRAGILAGARAVAAPGGMGWLA